jgi:hypothetical protein
MNETQPASAGDTGGRCQEPPQPQSMFSVMTQPEQVQSNVSADDSAAAGGGME